MINATELEIFRNPTNLPLEKVIVVVGKKKLTGTQKVNALDEYWVEKREFHTYEKPPRNKKDDSAYDSWICGAECYLENLTWLLCLDYHRFWSNMVFNQNIINFLISFLQECGPPYEDMHALPKICDYQTKIYRDVFVIFCRLITNNETDSKWMTREFMASLIYDNYIFSIPIIWDICLKYGMVNKKEVSKLVNSVFELQPLYVHDTAVAIDFVKETFKYIILQVNDDYLFEDPPNLPRTFKGFSKIVRDDSPLTIQHLKQIVLYLLDTALTLRLFIEAYSNAADIYLKIHLISSLNEIYEYGVPFLYEKLNELSESLKDQKEIEEYIDFARLELINTFREILTVYKNRILRGEGNIRQAVESYSIALFKGALGRVLIRDYNALYHLDEDIQFIQQINPEMDSVQMQIICRGTNINPFIQSSPQLESADDESQNDVGCSELCCPGPSKPEQQRVQEEKLINEVKTVMPELGEGFILKCLEYYNFRSDIFIDCLVGNNLPKHLKDLDRTMPIIPEDPLNVEFLETDLSRLNLFEDTTRDDDKYTKGKLDNEKNNIKKHMMEQRNSLLSTEDALYADEYDDSLGFDDLCLNTDDYGSWRPYAKSRAFRLRSEISEMESSEKEQSKLSDPGAGTSGKKKQVRFSREVFHEKKQADNYQARRGNRNKHVGGKYKSKQEKEVPTKRKEKVSTRLGAMNS